MIFGELVDPSPDDVTEQIERDRLADELAAQREWDEKFEAATSRAVNPVIDSDEADVQRFIRGRRL